MLKLVKALLILIVLAAGVLAFMFLTRQAALEAGPGWTEGLAMHGRFCGPGHPFVDSIGTAAEAQRLRSIRPKDSLDAACKTHDLCYIERGYFDPSCDRALAARLGALAARFEDQATEADADPELALLCAQMARLMADYFQQRPAHAEGMAALRLWFEDAVETEVDLRAAGPAAFDLYLGGEHDQLVCGVT